MFLQATSENPDEKLLHLKPSSICSSEVARGGGKQPAGTNQNLGTRQVSNPHARALSLFLKLSSSSPSPPWQGGSRAGVSCGEGSARWVLQVLQHNSRRGGKEPPDGSEQWSFSLAFQSPTATGTRRFRERCEILVMGNYGIISLQGGFFPAQRHSVQSMPKE